MTSLNSIGDLVAGWYVLLELAAIIGRKLNLKVVKRNDLEEM
jgi:hypothetical protein